MDIVDTHCHIHEITDNPRGNTPVHNKWAGAGVADADQVIADAEAQGVTRLVCVGTTISDSRLAVAFVQSRPQTWATIGIHPHEAAACDGDAAALADFASLAGSSKVVAVGECGLDYYYNHSPKSAQERILRFQMELAVQYNLPMSFHVRDAFDDFWPIFDAYPGIRGVVHSFTAGRAVLDQALERGLYIALNGIATFTKDQEQLAAAKAVPLERLVVETDAPYLTPSPYRGKICEPKHARTNLAFIAELHELPESEAAAATTANACRLFNLV